MFRHVTDARSLASSGVGMALKRQHAIRRNHPGSQSSASSVSSKERRILSLSHVTGNKGSGASVKRSHSVRSNMPSRKVSWGAGDAAANKENEAFPEPDELDHSSKRLVAANERLEAARSSAGLPPKTRPNHTPPTAIRALA